MASLTTLHWEQVPLPLQKILREIGTYPFAKRFYLAGGTALSLQLGHRTSADLDFFSTTDELEATSRQEIIVALKQQFTVEADEGGLASLYLTIEGVDVGFFHYSYPLLSLPIIVEGIHLASLLDIGLMKMDAIATRGARKDFYDLYFIAQYIPLADILERGQEKFPYVRDIGMMFLMALVDFGNADLDTPVQTVQTVAWDEVKTFFAKEAKRLGRTWFQSHQ